MVALAPAAGTYGLYEFIRRMGQPRRQIMRAWSTPFLMSPFSPARKMGAFLDAVGQARLTHGHPNFAIQPIQCGKKLVAVTQETVLTDTFCDLVHFRKDTKQPGPKVLIIAPMSGHFATLVRGTITQMLQHHDVYVTDWKNARDIPLLLGTFDSNDYVQYLMTYLRKIGHDTNVLAVCQAAPLALAAVSILSQDNDPAVPATLTLIAGPIDPRVNPTKVNEFAMDHTIGQFRTSTINYVPWPLLGTGRSVYPGFRQVGGFMSMNMEQHVSKHQEHFNALVRGDDESTVLHRAFYDEYCAVMDLTAEFYLDTVARVFQLFHLPRGEFYWHDRLVEPQAITKTAVLTIEGGADDITGVGQTKAALELLTGLTTAKQGYHLEEAAGHYGVFNGRRFKKSIEPQIRTFILAHS